MIEKFGIQLNPLTLKSAQKVRAWRNSEAIIRFMDFKGHITESMQTKWFRKVQASNDFYFSIEYNHTSIGLIHLNQFDKESKTAFAGLFIGEQKYTDTGIAFAASIALLDFAFDEVKLKKVFAKVHRNNNIAIDYNTYIGFKCIEKLDSNFVKMEIDASSFQNRRDQIIKLL